MRLLPLSALIAFVAALASASPPAAVPAPVAAATVNDRFGIDHISYGNGRFSADRYRLALDAGAAWNRWVFYWHDIERTPGGYDFSTQDATVRADRAQGLKILGLLFGTPHWAVDETYRVAAVAEPGSPDEEELLPRVGQKGWPEDTPSRLQGTRTQQVVNSVLPPRGLFRPVFVDGTDSPSLGKAVNPENLWARFVHRTVTQYKGSVHAWEIWNEPDFIPTASTAWFGFWAGGVDNYARMLKVAYLVIKSVDPAVPIVMGGMAFWHQPEFFPRLLRSITRDPIARQYGYYFDATAWHWYSRPSQLYERTLWVEEELAAAGVTGKQNWVTETNLPVCGDPGVAGTAACGPGTFRGTVEQQAAYIIQAIAYGFVAGVDKIFFFQLFDDQLQPGEHFGLVRNNGTPRPALTALKTATTYFNTIGQGYRTLSGAGKIEMMNFPAGAGQRLRAVWNTDPNPMTASLPVDASSFSLIEQAGQVQNPSSAPGSLFKLGLPTATLNNAPSGTAPDYVVGGRPFLLLERGVPSGNGSVEGLVRDNRGRVASGVPVLSGEQRATTDAAGRYRLDLPPGLYDVALSTIVPLSDPSYSVPVWAGRVSTQSHLLRQLYQNFLPIGPYRARPVR